MEVDLGPCEWMLVDCVSGFCCLTHTNSLGVCTLRRWRTGMGGGGEAVVQVKFYGSRFGAV